MIEFVLWIAICFVSGAVPWAVILGKFWVGGDVRSVGDGNPGATNLWKMGGWMRGVVALVLEIGKSLVPVLIAIVLIGQPTSSPEQIGIALVALSPIVGHAWSPFLRLKGGKALAASLGAWVAITMGLAIPVACVLLIIMHGLQKNHAITITVCLLGFLVVFLPLLMQPYIIIFWVFNLIIVIYKHKSEYAHGIIFRTWIRRIVGSLD